MRVLAACDSQYYYKYFPTFYASATEAGYTPVLHLVDPSEDIIKQVSDLDIETSISTCRSIHKKNYYAHVRFFAAETHLRNGPLLITDIDVIFRRLLPTPTEDVGVFIREYEWYPGMKSMAGIVWLDDTHNAIHFIRLVNELINKRPEEWYADQYAIYDAYNHLCNSVSIKHFTNIELDWDFTSTSYIWSGKGNRKHSVKKYIELSSYYHDKFNIPSSSR
jgi:hypothetical protein